MKRVTLALITCLFLATLLSTPTARAQQAFVPQGHTYIYDIGGDGNVKCTWETTIIPLQYGILYSYTFRGGEISDVKASDVLGQELDVNVEEQDGQRTAQLFLSGYTLNEVYSFNFSFTWSGLLTRKNDRHTLFTSVNVGDPQQAKILVILPKDAKLSSRSVSWGNVTADFVREMISGRDALVWEVADTGNDTQIFFTVNFKFYSTLFWIQDNLLIIIVVIVIVVVGAILLGYGKRWRPLISRALKSLSERF
jgi:uncharacterized protein YpmB